MKAVPVWLLGVLTLGACGGSPAAPSSTPALVGLVMGADGVTIAKHATADLKATAQWSDGSTTDVTAKALWTSSNPEIASVRGGTVIGVLAGTAVITAGYEGFLQTTTVTVRRALSIFASAYVLVTKPALLQRVDVQLDGRSIAQCSPTLTDTACTAEIGNPPSAASSIDPGHHVLTVAVTALPPDARASYELTVGIRDADTSQPLTYVPPRGSVDVWDGPILTWEFDVDAYR